MMEAIIEWLYNFCKDTAGEKNGRKFFPWSLPPFSCLFEFNALMNLIPGYNSILTITTAGQVPLLRGANTDINTALALSLISFVFVDFWGIQANRLGFLKQFFNVRTICKVGDKLFHGKLIAGFGDIGFGFLDIYRRVSGIFHSLYQYSSAFTFRLFGNMLGWRNIGTYSVSPVDVWGFGIIPIIYGFEMLIGVMQALIFAGLTLVFASMAVTSHEEEEHT